ncbi:MAG: FMN-binding protein [Anaerocolumna sp.]|jgi:electron transport complex protein RnfG|nr:FMN-binding protein [Anaerocolumna sp.]
MSNENKKNTILKDTLVLVVITVIAGFLLGLVYEVTAPIIAQARLEEKLAAYKSVFSEAAEFVEDEDLNAQVATATDNILIPNGYKNITIDEARIAVDASGNKLGYIVTVSTKNGYKDVITLSIGLGLEGDLKGLEIIYLNETAGLGQKASEKAFKEQFVNKTVDKFEVTKSGATADNQIDAISGATITSSAVAGAVNSGICFVANLAQAGN